MVDMRLIAAHFEEKVTEIVAMFEMMFKESNLPSPGMRNNIIQFYY